MWLRITTSFIGNIYLFRDYYKNKLLVSLQHPKNCIQITAEILPTWR